MVPATSRQTSNAAVQAEKPSILKDFKQLQRNWQPVYRSPKLLSNYRHADKPVFARPETHGSNIDLALAPGMDMGSPRYG